MKLFPLIAVCVAALPAAAKERAFDKKVEPSLLQQELKAAGFKVKEINCLGTACVLRLEDTETKDPGAVIAAHVWDAQELKKKRELAELRALAEKWKAGTITPAEKDQLILRFILRGLPESL